MRTSNPALNAKTFERFGPLAAGEGMTIDGTVHRAAFLLLLLVATATWTWVQTFAGTPTTGYLWGGLLGGFVVALITIFKPTLAPVTAPIYALLEGLALGAISAFFEARYPGIVIQAVALTFGVLVALLIAYRSGAIPVTQNFRMGVVAATGGIAVFYLVAIGMSFFGVRIAFLHEGSLLGIGFSVFVVVIASLNLVLDFDFIEKGAEQGAPKFMEWYAAFGLMVTLIWLYLEILRLLSKLRSR
ncbi:MAG: Bax inhibitor-1/YccA family protein [Gemmatimonadales bacterium]|nr:Bax inhibitor-1/YccA family protein [Gemmatimonadales bacterium]